MLVTFKYHCWLVFDFKTAELARVPETVKVDIVKVDCAAKYIVAADPRATVFTKSCGVVKELEKIRPPPEVLEEIMASTLFPWKLAV
ncbi:MAG: hypothetical protein KCHDKBKB_02017 [Elusimicrobia bacterium]|nr:hypothetical protein [Elusimicrobiota bacterium]